MLAGRKLTVYRLLPTGMLGHAGAQPGEAVAQQGTLFAACGEGTWLELVEVQLEGKRRMSAGEFLRGHALSPGTRLG
jgi:methionyl-tRNA formyltransferase